VGQGDDGGAFGHNDGEIQEIVLDREAFAVVIAEKFCYLLGVCYLCKKVFGIILNNIQLAIRFKST